MATENMKQHRDVNYVFLVQSDPKKVDTDGDESNDDVDAKPKTVNDEAIYVLYNSDKFMNEAMYWIKKYEKEGCYVEINACDTIPSFKENWNNMGMVEGKEEYQIKKVYLLFHGDVGLFSFPDGDDDNTITDYIGTDYSFISPYLSGCGVNISISELSNKRIELLILNICQSGNIDYINSDSTTYIENTSQKIYGYNLAVGFLLNQPNVQMVRAWNGFYKVQCNVCGFNEFGNKDGVDEYQAYEYYRSENGTITYVTNTKIEQTGIYTWWGK